MSELRIGEMKVDPTALKALRKAIRFMPEKVASRRIMVGMKRAMKPTKQAASNMAPDRSGALAKAFHVVNGRRAIDGSPYVVFRVNPKKSVSYTNEQGTSVAATPKTYFHHVAYGVGPSTRTTKRRGFSFFAYDDDYRPMLVKKIKHPGVDGQDIIGDAWKQTAARVKSTMLSEIARSVDQYKQKHGIP